MVLNKTYSNIKIQRELSSIASFGQFEGGKHIIEGLDSDGNKLTFEMLSDGAWRGGKAIYYKLIKKELLNN
jgi:hypothetical protein